MKREDLGKMLERRAMKSAAFLEGPEMFQEAAEGFWNDVIDVLISRMEYQYNIMREVIEEPYEWLEGQKIGDDE